MSLIGIATGIVGGGRVGLADRGRVAAASLVAVQAGESLLDTRPELAPLVEDHQDWGELLMVDAPSVVAADERVVAAYLGVEDDEIELPDAEVR